MVLFLVFAPLTPVLHTSNLLQSTAAFAEEPTVSVTDTVQQLLENPVENAQALFDLLPGDNDPTDTDQIPDAPNPTSDTSSTDDGGAPDESVLMEEILSEVDVLETAASADATADTSTEQTNTNDAELSDMVPEGDNGTSELNDAIDAISNAIDTASAYVGSSGGSSVPEIIADAIDELPNTAEGLRDYRDQRQERQEIVTGDANQTATGVTTDYSGLGDTASDSADASSLGEDGTVVETINDVNENEVNLGENTDDGIVSSTGEEVNSTTVENEQNLDIENQVTGESITGNNEIESDKDILEGTITTGNAGISASQEQLGNGTNVTTTGGGGGGWVQRLYGYRTDVSNSGDDNMLSATEEGFKELTIINKNKAFVSNIHDLFSLTGRNSIRAQDRFKDGGITTGDAQVKSSLLNIINTTTVDSKFLPITLDLFDSHVGDINILELLFDAFGATLDGENAVTSEASASDSGDDSIVSAESNTADSLTFLDEEEGYIYNDQDLKAVTGQNRITSGYKTKDTEIKTGDARITQNLINFLNTTLFKSKVGVVVVNVFADLQGDFIIPDARMFADNVVDPDGVVAAGGDTTVNNSDDSINNAIAVATSNKELVNDVVGGVKHEITVDANTGSNETLFDKDGNNINIISGDTKVQSNLLTLANRNIIGKAFSQGFFNILGDWNGGISGVSDDARVEGTGDNFIISTEAQALHGGNTLTADATTVQDGADDSIVNAEATVGSSVTVNTKKEGIVVNRAHLTGITGENDVISYKGNDVTIETGDVHAATNMATFLNNTFSYTKGLVVAFNVFGSWTGDLKYNEVQDLSIAVDAFDTAEALQAGDNITYEVAAKNSGSEPTPATTADFGYDASAMTVADADGGTVNGNTITYAVPAMQAGDSVEFNPTLTVMDSVADDTVLEATGFIYSDDPIERNNQAVRRDRIGQRVARSFITEDTTDTDSGSTTTDTTGDNSNTQDTSDNTNTTGSDTDTNSDTTTDNDTGADTNTDGGSNTTDTQNDTENTETSNDGNTSSGGSGYVHSGGSAELTVTKVADNAGPFDIGESVGYIVVVSNTGQKTIDDIVAYDVMHNDSLNDAGDSWELGQLEPGQEFVIEYTLTVLEDMPSGSYANTAYASGFADDTLVRSNESVATISISNSGYVAPASNTTSSGGGGSSYTNSSTSGGTVADAGATSIAEDQQDEAGATSTDETFEVVDSFTGGGVVLGANDEQADDQTVASGASSATAQSLSTEEKAEIETQVVQQMRESSSVTKHVVPVAQAAETPEGFDYNINENTDDPTKVVLADDATYAVYPNFLYFDGATDSTATQSAFSFAMLMANPLFWIILVIVLLMGYWSYRTKKNKARQWN